MSTTGGPSPTTLPIYPTVPIITPHDPSVTLTTTTSQPITTITTTATMTTTYVPPSTTTSSSEVPPSTTTTPTTYTKPTRTRTTQTQTSTSSDTTTTYYTTTTEPTVPPTSPPSEDSSGALSTGAIVGIVVAAVVALIALVFAAYMVSRRKRRKRDRTSNTVLSQPYMQENYRPGGGGGGGDGGGGSDVGVVSNEGRDRLTSKDAILASGFSNITSATGGGRYGYEPEVGVAAGAAVGGYAYDRQQQLQHRHGPPYPSSHQVNYTPPNEPEYSQGDMYNQYYAGLPQDDPAYRQYQQEQLYRQHMQMQQEQERLAATAALTGYYPKSRPSEFSPATSNRNSRYSEFEQERHLQQLLHRNSVTTGAFSDRTIPMATPSSVNYPVQGQYPQATPPQEYVDPESDVRYGKSEPWPAPPTPALPPTPAVARVSSSPIPVFFSASPLVSGRPISMEVPGSTSPLSTGSGKRSHAPQESPEYKRGPQVLNPGTIQSIKEEEIHQQEQPQSQDPQASSSEDTYIPPPTAPVQWKT